MNRFVGHKLWNSGCLYHLIKALITSEKLMAQHQYFIIPRKHRGALGIYTSCISAPDRAKTGINQRQFMQVKHGEIH